MAHISFLIYPYQIYNPWRPAKEVKMVSTSFDERCSDISSVENIYTFFLNPPQKLLPGCIFNFPWIFFKIVHSIMKDILIQKLSINMLKTCLFLWQQRKEPITALNCDISCNSYKFLSICLSLHGVVGLRLFYPGTTERPSHITQSVSILVRSWVPVMQSPVDSTPVIVDNFSLVIVGHQFQLEDFHNTGRS